MSAADEFAEQATARSTRLDGALRSLERQCKPLALAADDLRDEAALDVGIAQAVEQLDLAIAALAAAKARIEKLRDDAEEVSARAWEIAEREAA